TGQFSIGHAGFMGVGAYVSAMVSIHLGQPWVADLARVGLPVAVARGAALLVSLLAGGAAAALAGYVVGLPSLRLRGDCLAFVLGSFFAGIAGGLFAHDQTYLNPSTFQFVKSIEVIAMVVLGGLGSVTGSVLAAVILTLLPEVLRPIKDLRMVIYSLMLIVLMIARPQGLFGSR